MDPKYVPYPSIRHNTLIDRILQRQQSSVLIFLTPKTSFAVKPPIINLSCLGLPTNVGNVQLGVSWPANPAFITPLPLSIHTGWLISIFLENHKKFEFLCVCVCGGKFEHIVCVKMMWERDGTSIGLSRCPIFYHTTWVCGGRVLYESNDCYAFLFFVLRCSSFFLCVCVSLSYTKIAIFYT